jgi:hypothetical protein
MVMYTTGGAQGNGIVTVGATAPKTYTFRYSDGYFLVGAAAYQTNGDINGSVWSPWGSASAFTAINARIEARAQAWAVNYYNSSVIDTRMAGEVAFNRSGNTGKWQNSGYVFTGVQGTSSGGDATYFARQPQRLINTQGWAAAFIF